MDTRRASHAESAAARRVSALRFASIFALMLAMLFGPVTESSASGACGVAADSNDHASRQHPLPAGAVDVVAEAEESRDELEERGTAHAVGLLSAGWNTLASLQPVPYTATWWVGRPRLGGAGGLGRGPPARV